MPICQLSASLVKYAIVIDTEQIELSEVQLNQSYVLVRVHSQMDVECG